MGYMAKKRIMVADDDPAILDVLSLVLRDAGYDVETTAGRDTEKHVHKYKPDVLLLDIWMAGRDGRDICKNLKNQKKSMNIPVIMISAHRDGERISQLAGANDFISKPFELSGLLAKVKAYAFA